MMAVAIASHRPLWRAVRRVPRGFRDDDSPAVTPDMSLTRCPREWSRRCSYFIASVVGREGRLVPNCTIATTVRGSQERAVPATARMEESARAASRCWLTAHLILFYLYQWR